MTRKKSMVELNKKLFEAVKEGDLRKIKSLVKKGANPNARDENGRNPLHVATYGINPEIINYFLELGANPNARDKDNATPLHYAVLYQREEMIKKLLEKGANPEARDNKGKTPLDMLIIAEGVSEEKIERIKDVLKKKTIRE